MACRETAFAVAVLSSLTNHVLFTCGNMSSRNAPYTQYIQAFISIYSISVYLTTISIAKIIAKLNDRMMLSNGLK
jgi:hypothetical protein